MAGLEVCGAGGDVPQLEVRDTGVESISSQSLSSPRLSRKTQEEVIVENDTSNGEDPDNYPLHSPWSYWFDRSHRGGDAGDFFANLRRLATVTSIKAFWRVFNNLPTCDELQDRESYHLMRDECRRPVWEDADNAMGGMWVIKLDRQYTVKTWQELLLAAIGEQLSTAVHPDDDICGVSVRIRYDSAVIQIWNQDSDFSSKATVLERVKELVPSLEVRGTYYQSNKEKMRGSLSKPVSGHHRGVSPPPPSMVGPHPKPYSGGPHLMYPHPPPRGVFGGPPVHGLGFRPQHPPPFHPTPPHRFRPPPQLLTQHQRLPQPPPYP